MTVPPLTPPSGEPGPGQPHSYGAPRYPVSHYGQYYGQPAEGPPPSKTMAGWALGLSILNCFSVGVFVAIGLAIAVLVKGQRDGRNHGKGLAIAALIISTLWILAFVVIVVLMVTGRIEIDDSQRDTSGELSEKQTISPYLLREGDCIGVGEIDEMLREIPLEVTAVPCSELHSGEVYLVFDLADGDFPGDAEAVRLAETGCVDAFRPFVGVSHGRSTLDITFLSPDSVNWRIADDREVLCFLSERDGMTTGTLEGTRR